MEEHDYTSFLISLLFASQQSSSRVPKLAANIK